LKIYIVT